MNNWYIIKSLSLSFSWSLVFTKSPYILMVMHNKLSEIRHIVNKLYPYLITVLSEIPFPTCSCFQNVFTIAIQCNCYPLVLFGRENTCLKYTKCRNIFINRFFSPPPKKKRVNKNLNITGQNWVANFTVLHHIKFRCLV